MATWINRGLSLLIFLLYISAGYFSGGPATALNVFIGLLFPMACIWFAEPLGDYTGIIRGQLMTSSSPAVLVCTAGWFILIGVPIIVFFITKGTSN
jgi:hypothetical protein